MISKLPVRQCTIKKLGSHGCSLSKLPVRQCTIRPTAHIASELSKLPVRQCTATVLPVVTNVVSKLPVRQCTSMRLRSCLHAISKLPVRQCTEIISLHHHDFHTKKAKNTAQTLFYTPEFLIYKSMDYIWSKIRVKYHPSFPHPEQKTPVPYPLTNGYTYS